MLAILHPNTSLDSEAYRQTLHYLENLPGVTLRVHEIQGASQRLTEIYLLGDTKTLNKKKSKPCQQWTETSGYPKTTGFWAGTKMTIARVASPITAWSSARTT